MYNKLTKKPVLSIRYLHNVLNLYIITLLHKYVHIYFFKLLSFRATYRPIYRENESQIQCELMIENTSFYKVNLDILIIL